MRRLLLVPLALGLTSTSTATPARAEPTPPATLEEAARDDALWSVEPGSLEARAWAQLGADLVEATAAVGAEARYAGRRCDYLRAGGQLRLGVGEDRRLAAEQWASVCVPLITMEFGHHLEWDVRPSLLAPLGLRAGRFRRETLRFHWEPLRGRLGTVLAAVELGESAKQGLPPPRPRTPAEEARLPQGEIVIFDVDAAYSFLWEGGGDGELAVHNRIEAAPFRYLRERFVLDIGAGGGEFTDDASLVHVWLLKLENLGLGPLDATAGFGMASGNAGPFVSDVEREIAVTVPRIAVGLAVPGERFHVGARGSYDVALAADGYVTVDARVDASLEVTGKATRVSLDGNAARTEVHVPGAPGPLRAMTGGGALAVTRRLTPHLTATTRLEVARSFYAADVVNLDAAPRWGVAGFAVLEAAIAR
jgi:hypothetical protein